MIQEIVLTALMSMTPTEKKALDNFQARLERNGYDISQYIEDPRFGIYRFKKGKHINYADTTESWYMKRDSIEKCADFIEEEYYWLKKAENEFGPSPEHIASQLQLETNCGQYTGERSLLNSFISVYIDRPDRRNEFYRYMTDFLDLFADTTDNIVLPTDIFKINGSWAGAYGIAQMMPDVLKKYGKISDFDGDGYFDPMNMPDAIGFMARYLADHGFGKNALGATHDYNSGHPFYASSIGKHAAELMEIMENRMRIPPEKIRYRTDAIIIDMKTPKYDSLRDMKPAAIMPQARPLGKNRLFNRRLGRR
ncbi:MAG: lytic murein transglycosylase [Candidatus Aenigmarchaeota archaeon]|nr:lytic murein transglycosylase [Candidatus Aenigmarchaeota archaeon]